MVRTAIVILPLLAAAGAAPAQEADAGSYYVRNETSRSFSCGMRRERARKVHRFLLRRGSDYRHEDADGGARTLLCDIRYPTQRFRMQAGVRYALVERAGYVTLRRVEASLSAP